MGRFELWGDKNVLSVIDESGDSKIVWDANKPEEVEAARRQFDYLVKEKKYSAYSVDKKGGQDKKITRFDPNAEAIIMVPAVAGGGA